MMAVRSQGAVVYFLMSSSKAKAKGVSATSFFDLKAELSKKETEFLRARAEGRSLAVVGGVKRPDKVILSVA